MSKKTAETLLFLVTIAWGSSYMFMKLGLDTIAPFNLIALRFGIGFLVTIPFLIYKRKKLTPKTWVYGSILGILLFLIFTCILFGIGSTTTSNAGFLVGLTVVFVPILQGIWLRKMPGKKMVFTIF